MQLVQIFKPDGSGSSQRMTKVSDVFVATNEFAMYIPKKPVGILIKWPSSTCCVIFQIVSECLSRIDAISGNVPLRLSHFCQIALQPERSKDYIC